MLCDHRFLKGSWHALQLWIKQKRYRLQARKIAEISVLNMRLYIYNVVNFLTILNPSPIYNNIPWATLFSYSYGLMFIFFFFVMFFFMFPFRIYLPWYTDRIIHLLFGYFTHLNKKKFIKFYFNIRNEILHDAFINKIVFFHLPPAQW